MTTFVKVERLEKKELLHEYFLLDLALVLIDSIDQVSIIGLPIPVHICAF